MRVEGEMRKIHGVSLRPFYPPRKLEKVRILKRPAPVLKSSRNLIKNEEMNN